MMFLIDSRFGDLVRVEDIDSLMSPVTSEVMARGQAGEEEQDWAAIPKAQLRFPSGEALPLCWTDANYRQHPRRSTETASR